MVFLQGCFILLMMYTVQNLCDAETKVKERQKH